MGTSTTVLLVIPVLPGWDVPAAVRDVSSFLAQRGLSPVLTNDSDDMILTLLNQDTAQRIRLVVTTREKIGHSRRDDVLDVVIRCSGDVEGVLSRLVERLGYPRLLTPSTASHVRDEEILLRRLTDLGYL
jgi:hypothetical protein